ncbi:MAG: putative acetyltransferase [Saprospiraceae bacterium]|jgi:predicted acetyltransferase
MKSVIRSLSEEEHIEFIRLKLKSFPREGGFNTETIDEILNEFNIKNEKGVRKAPYGLFRNGELLGGMYLSDLSLNFHDEIVLMGGLGAVATDLLHKKEGVAREMVTYFFEHYEAKGAAIVSLYAFRLDFYRKMGFGFGTKTDQYRIRPADLPRREKDELVYLEKDDLEMILGCYNLFSKQNHGMVIHAEGWWMNLMNKEMITIGYMHHNQLKGYCTFEYVKGAENPYWFDIKVHHFIYENREAFSQLIGFLASQIDQAEFIIFETQDEDFHNMLNYPHNGRPFEILLHHQSNIQEVGICYRVINIPKIFDTLQERNFADANLTLKITIEDSFYPNNEGSTIVKFIDGTPSILQNDDDFDVEITMDISEFSAMIMGSVGFKKLYDYGFAQVSDKMYVLTINKIFISQKPICISRF